MIMSFVSDLKELFSDFSTENATSFGRSHYLLISGVISTAIALKLLRTYLCGGVCHSNARLDGKTVIITGANTGIGLETARDLARRGARVVLACRDATRGESAAKDIRQSTGNGNVEVRILDLASLASVRKFAADTLKVEKDIHILINNAGIMMCPQWKSEEGYEMQFAVNHLGHFLLTNLLLSKLKSSAPSRIVNVSSLAHTRGVIKLDDINSSVGYHPHAAYAQSKLANVLFSRELSNRLKGSGVTVNALHPGMVKTELPRYMTDAGYPVWLIYLVYPLFLFISKTPSQGAQTSIHCAVSEEVENVSGKYFSDCHTKDAKLPANDEEVARKLWEISENLVAQKFS